VVGGNEIPAACIRGAWQMRGAHHREAIRYSDSTAGGWRKQTGAKGGFESSGSRCSASSPLSAGVPARRAAGFRESSPSQLHAASCVVDHQPAGARCADFFFNQIIDQSWDVMKALKKKETEEPALPAQPPRRCALICRG